VQLRRYVAVCLLAGGLATAGAWLVGSLPVDVGLDLDTPVPGGITARWHGGKRAFEEISPEFAPHRFRVEMTSPESAEGQPSDGFQVVAMAGVAEVEFSPESAWANASTYFFLHGAERPARLLLEGWNLGPDPYLSFESDMRSGLVEVSFGDGDPAPLNLYSEERGQVVLPIQCDERSYRFHGQVPRRALAGLTFDFPGGERPVVRRLFASTIVPRVLYSGETPRREPLAVVTEQWLPTWDEGGFALPRRFCLGASFWSTFAILFAASALGFWAAPALLRRALALLRTAWAARINHAAIPPFRLRVFLSFWAPLVFAWGVFLLAFYPGTMNLDSLAQWQQAQTGAFEHGHPPFYAMVMWGASRAWNSPSSVGLLQILAGAAALAFGFSLLWRAGVPKWIVAVAYVLALVSMRNATMMISLIKDTPYGICMLAGAVLMASNLLFRGADGGWKRWASLGAVLGLMGLFRYNGPHVLVVLLPLLGLVFLKRIRGWAVCVAIVVIMHFGVTHALFSALRVAQGEFGLQNLLTAHLSILVDRDVPMSDEEYTFLSNVRTLSDRWAYYESRGDSTTLPFLNCYNSAWAGAHFGEYTRLYAKLVARNPVLASRYFWDRGSFLYLPWSTDVPMEKSFLGVTPNDQGLASMQFLVSLPGTLRGYLKWTESDGASWLFWRPAIPLYLVLAACAVLCVRARDVSWFIVYAPFLINTAILTLCGIGHNSRYQYPLTLSAGFLIALAFIPGRILRAPPATPPEKH
jgi:hypothetical protein